MSQDWVEIYKSFPSEGLALGLKRVQSAGIPVRVIEGSPNTRWMYRYLQDRDSIYVPSQHVERARGILAQWEQDSGVRVERHLKGLPSELAVGVALTTFVMCVMLSLQGFTIAAIVTGLICIAFMPAAWRRLKKNKKAQLESAATKRRWF